MSGETSQTLDRGLRVLELLAVHPEGLTAAELSVELRTARAVVYRLLRTLAGHGMVVAAGARYCLGFAVLDLARGLQPRLRAVAQPLLHRLSVETDSAALVTIADGDDALVLLTQAPPHADTYLAMREGSRHPLTVGADGVAILIGRAREQGEPRQVTQARRKGYAVSLGAIQPGAVGVAAPIVVSGGCMASIGIVHLGERLRDRGIPARVVAAAEEAAARLGGASG